VKRNKDLNACIAELQAMLCGNVVEPEQRKYVEQAVELLRRFRRKANPSPAIAYRFVRQIAEQLVEAYLRK